MATHRAALAWASFTISSALYGTAWAQQQTPNGPSIPMEYCAAVNTADMVPLLSNYQSDGRCFDNCTDLKYALAIVQYKSCWCSNLIPNPADQKSLSNCQDSCPGYPSDYCGGDGLFGYMEVGGFKPTGTAPAGGSTTKKPSSSSSTVRPTMIVTSSQPSASASSTSPSSSSSSSSSITTSSGSPTQGPVMTTITVGGTVRTVTATPAPSDPNGEAQIRNQSTGLQGGAVAGIVVGVVGGLAVIAAFLWLWFSRRRRREVDEVKGLGDPIGGGSSPRTLATPKTSEVNENRFTPGSTGPAAAAWDASNKRRSHLMPIDPRLDPFAKGIYASDQNRSRESFNSLQDNQDYSRRVHEAPRVLRATNPDPDDD